MKIKTTKYNPKKSISREKLANPFSNESIEDRLIESDALDLVENHAILEIKNGYIDIKAINKKKYLKKEQ